MRGIVPVCETVFVAILALNEPFFGVALPLARSKGMAWYGMDGGRDGADDGGDDDGRQTLEIDFNSTRILK